ncbi:hypothetical protein [Saccharospirillum mangrovi]|uniref:hypothetical protein n=1 Tax=Saccharospirillum mangrovi TaxID=2161747 RepID=UPI000D3B8037|nr:hypothetical protein [Saccharospirillum mangrovi]
MNAIKATLLILVTTVLLAACAQAPSKLTTTVDDRPRLAFELPEGTSAQGYSVVIDGIDYGDMSQYLAGTRSASAVRIVPGRHVVEVWYRSQQKLSEEIFLSDGDTRILKVTP